MYHFHQLRGLAHCYEDFVLLHAPMVPEALENMTGDGLEVLGLKKAQGAEAKPS